MSTNITNVHLPLDSDKESVPNGDPVVAFHNPSPAARPTGIFGLRLLSSPGILSKPMVVEDKTSGRYVCTTCGCDEQIKTDDRFVCVHDDGTGVPRRIMHIAIVTPKVVISDSDFTDWSRIYNTGSVGDMTILFTEARKAFQQKRPAAYLHAARRLVHLFSPAGKTSPDIHGRYCNTKASDAEIEDMVFDPIRFSPILVSDRCKWFYSRIVKFVAGNLESITVDASSSSSSVPISHSSYAIQLPSAKMTPVGVKLYIYLLYSGYRMPSNTIIPESIIWELHNINEFAFRNPRIRDLCTSVVTQTLNDDTIYSRALESHEFDNRKLFNACVEYLCSRFESVYTKEVFYTIPAPMLVEILANASLSPVIRFKAAKTYLFARSLYHSPVCPQERIDRGEMLETYNETHKACNDVVDTIPWTHIPKQVLIDTTEPTTDEAREFKLHCCLYSFWLRASEQLGKYK